MEEVKAYIESGILELYVLGQLTAQECNEVEAMAAKHPEVKAEITAIELAMEAYAFENAIAPSANVEAKILAEIDSNPIEKEPKILPLYQQANDSKVRALCFALVACIALLVVSVVALYNVYNKLSVANEQIATLSTNNEQFARTVNKLEFDNSGLQNRVDMTETDEWTTVKLAGVAASPKAKMLVYWNKNNKNILINHAAMDLPKTDKTHEYQLWALVDGKPVSLGVFGENAKEAVQQMVTIEKAQAFAVTIEPVGGSINPTMEKMVVMGGVSI
ncbi:MAG: anti-sigma factor [Chitinophagaceae bacterium]|nr:MAG: anti-sigma factor [Chitinophagaceae bacterium]